MISQSISRDFSPRLYASRSAPKIEAPFSAQELLEISRHISREYAPSRASQQSRLVLLAVSPEKLHAYWHIAKRRLTQALKRLEQPLPMTLRIYTEAKAEAQTDTEASQTSPSANQAQWFDLTINQVTGQQDIYLPALPDTSTPVRYRAALGESLGDKVFIPLAYSNITSAPHSIALEEYHELPNAITESIMQGTLPASSSGQSGSGQGK